MSVHEHGGTATVEEIRTGRKARLASLSDATTQIERWLRSEFRPPPDSGAESLGAEEVLDE